MLFDRYTLCSPVLISIKDTWLAYIKVKAQKYNLSRIVIVHF